MPAADNLNSIYKKYGKDNVSLIAQQQFGQLMAYEIDFPGRITSDTFKVKRTNSSENRVFWKDVFNIKNK